MATIAATIGVSEYLVAAALAALGIAATKHAIEIVKEWIQNREIDTTLDYHTLTKKHNFNSKCGEDCILQVANNLKVTKSYYVKNKIPYVVGDGKCKHGCTIEVRLSIPPGKTKWEIGTCMHKPQGVCLAK